MTSSCWSERILVRDGVRLVCRDWGGSGPDVLLLHGLAGHVGEWDDTARLLRDSGHRVVALDQRGHGASERHPGDVSRAAYVADVVAVVGELGLDRPVLVGQSLGGSTALLTAAAHPALPRALVLVEAGPGGANAGVQEQICGWLRAWPVPFPSREVAAAYLGGGREPVGEGWARGLEERPDGLWPRFDPEVMVRSLDEIATRAFWDEWAAIACPTLTVLGQGEQGGIISGAEYAEMVRLRPSLHGASLPGTGHDVHLERPDVLHRLIVDFLGRTL
ncbi:MULTISPECIES: alpha/beta fold hydrolase [Streptomyces]|uniref:Hydrolase n=2 Tax=Streptomyces venezuelae TaxID=54571 RepID=F2REH5_STRVP|nr:alpha/beta hydrolase [Streptomyces venezuelae]APE22847.1 alpha/beta hydrolase [Streptomyces venezuelae]QES00227.1 alpha/beta hydrolase [Streptomyces venezuelae ATCC 10712]CCA57098.1 hydrolase [Streptomyces venezuelae ATCC 10712]